MKGLLALYLAALAISWTTLALDIASLVQGPPQWITTETPASVPVHLWTMYGLFSVCQADSYSDSEPGGRHWHCRPFPQRGVDCGGGSGRQTRLESRVKRSGGEEEGVPPSDDQEGFGFCDEWRVAGYAQQLSLVFALANLVALTLTLLGTAAAGRGFRTDKLRSGWKLVAGLMTLQALCMCLSSSLVAAAFHHDGRFAYGSKLGRAWVETVVAYALDLFIVVVLLVTRATGKLGMVPGDDGYVPIDEDDDDRRDAAVV
ncbi:hypothetical protein JCM3770_001344 [Rhodotorula araucariae]